MLYVYNNHLFYLWGIFPFLVLVSLGNNVFFKDNPGILREKCNRTNAFSRIWLFGLLVTETLWLCAHMLSHNLQQELKVI